MGNLESGLFQAVVKSQEGKLIVGQNRNRYSLTRLSSRTGSEAGNRPLRNLSKIKVNRKLANRKKQRKLIFQ